MKNKIFLFLFVLLLQQGCATTSSLQTDNFENQQQQRLLSWHQDWVGTPHSLGGNNRSGIDCSAYVQRGYRKLYGIELPRTARSQRRQGIKVSYKKLTTGDLVFFIPTTYPNHVGIYLGDGTFIHVSKSEGVIRSRLDKGYWHKHYYYGKRIAT